MQPVGARQDGRRPQRRHARRRGPSVATLLRGLIIVTLTACCALTLKFGFPAAALARSLDAAAVSAGLGINQINVAGFRNTLSDDIFAALKTSDAGSLLSYDVTAAKLRLQALPWVESAEITRALPDGLDVAIHERRAFAVWQHRQLMFLIDADGRTLEPTSRAEHRKLPLIVGDGAEAAAHDLIDILQAHPAIFGRLEAAIYVGQRRWDLQLKDAPRLQLPEQAVSAALDWADRMQQDERLFDRRLAVVDLRVSGRVAFQIAPDPAKPAAKPGARAVSPANRGA